MQLIISKIVLAITLFVVVLFAVATIGLLLVIFFPHYFQ